MRIPLDYYRILGIPIQVTDEQLRQAYQDRSLQLPRREYSESAIAARKQLLEQAYEVLSDPDKKAAYNGEFLEKTFPFETIDAETSSTETEQTQESFSDNHTAWIEIDPQQLAGSLLLLQELGEYELVIRIGKRYLSADDDVKPVSKGASEPDGLLLPQNSLTIRADVILTMSLAYLELSREQWQQRQYEQAAVSGNKGLELLKEETLFFNLQQEIEADLYKLRPYRILELLALQLNQVQKRTKGLRLLQEMLQQRQGIDGKGDDRSGLNLDDFLRFIQQLRIYLTVEEQQHLFEEEAKRPSPVASYLKVYTQIAKGFAHREPDQILEAHHTLKKLGKRQDVYLEQAICCLLLGQTEEAIHTLEQCQETETLEFIQEQSQGQPDLLQGLCRYGERWLQTQVFSHFRDLINQQASLKKYFADREVQNYLEQLSENNLNLVAENSIEVAAGNYQSGWAKQSSQLTKEPVLTRSQATTQAYGVPQTTTATTATLLNAQYGSRSTPSSFSGTKTNPKKGYGETQREYTQGNVALSAAYEDSSNRRSYRRRHKPLIALEPAIEPTQSTPVLNPTPKRPTKTKSKSKSKKVYKQRLFLGIILLLGLGIGGGLLQFLYSSFSNAELEGDYLAIELHHSPLEIPAADAHVVVAGTLTERNAQQMLQEWLYSKSKAFGSKHQIERLQSVLADPMLSLWQNRALALQAEDSHYRYQHQVQLKSLKINPQNPDRAIVEAQVNEKASFYQNGKLNPKRSYDDKLLVRYELSRQNNLWKIRDSQVIQ